MGKIVEIGNVEVDGAGASRPVHTKPTHEQARDAARFLRDNADGEWSKHTKWASGFRAVASWLEREFRLDSDAQPTERKDG